MIFVERGLYKSILPAIAFLAIALATAPLAAALQVGVSNEVATVQQGKVAAFQVTVYNDGSRSQTVRVSAESDLPVSVSQESFTLAPGQSKTLNVLAVTLNSKLGVYLVNLKVRDNVKTDSFALAVNIVEGAPGLLFDAIYGPDLFVKQGQKLDWKFSIRNQGKVALENVIVSGDIPTQFNAEYPAPFSLQPGEDHEFDIPIRVPAGYPAGDISVTLKAASGSLQYELPVGIEVFAVGTVPATSGAGIAGTGFALFGGSVTVGLLILALVVLVLLYVRERNLRKETDEQKTDFTHLKSLVEEAKN